MAVSRKPASSWPPICAVSEWLNSKGSCQSRDAAAGNPLDQPDLDLLRRIANEDGIVDGSQPVGMMIFAPRPEDLDEVFAQLADRILTRLTR